MTEQDKDREAAEKWADQWHMRELDGIKNPVWGCEAIAFTAGIRHERSKSGEEIAALKAKLAKAKDALAYYRDSDTKVFKAAEEGGEIIEDEGDLASSTLAKLEIDNSVVKNPENLTTNNAGLNPTNPSETKED